MRMGEPILTPQTQRNASLVQQYHNLKQDFTPADNSYVNHTKCTDRNSHNSVQVSNMQC